MNQIRSEDPATYSADLSKIMEDNILHQAMEILERRLYREHTDPFHSPEIVSQYLQLKLAQLEHEEFHVLWLDTRHVPLAMDRLSIGSIDGASVYPREVVKAGLRQNAAAAILAHNHPSGNPEPSEADKCLTRRLKEALALVEIRLLDHFIVGGVREPISLASRGLV
jgi:DNA repair protein RadC